MAEKDEVQDPVLSYARRHGWFVRLLAWRGCTGAPDAMLIKGGRVVFMEFKTARGPLNGRQRREHSLMRAAGAELHVVRSFDDGVRILVGE